MKFKEEIKINPDKEEEKGINLSDMIKNILKRNKIESQRNEENNESQKKLNLIIDEYDGEKLNKSEGHTSNGIINIEYKKIFQDAIILLISQSMKKEWLTNDNSIDGNRFDLLEQIEKKTLTLVMTNSIQIHNLLEVTKKVLESVTTRYKLEEKERTYFLEGKNKQRTKQENDTNKSEKVMVTEQSKISVSESLEDSAIALKSSIPQFTTSYLELDEAFDYAGTPEAHDTDESKIENKFKYQEATCIGHGGESKLSILFEIDHYDNAFQKALSLAAVFEKTNIEGSTANSKHVLLHFNVNNKIPRQAFKFLDIVHNIKLTDKVTDLYEDFKNDDCRKYVFVGNFRTFRGLEHPRITIVVDRHIYSLQHYLVECIARCTTYINVALLGTNKTINIITQKWKEEINGNPLIESRKIRLSNYRKQSKDAKTQENEGNKIDVLSYNRYKELEQSFHEPSFHNNEVEDLTSKEDAKVASQI